MYVTQKFIRKFHYETYKDILKKAIIMSFSYIILRSYGKNKTVEMKLLSMKPPYNILQYYKITIGLPQL